MRAAYSKVSLAVLSLAFLGSATLARGDEPDISCKDLRYIEAAGEYGDGKAAFQLAQMYFKGVCGFPHNDQKGFELVFIAAMRGYSEAQFITGLYLHKGGEDSAALPWARRAAEQGHPNAQLLTSDLYLKGKGVTHNFDEGAKWALRSAEQGYSAAQGVVADLYDQGVGVNKNRIEADKWLLLCNRTHLGQKDTTSIGLADLQKSWERAMSAADVAEAHRRADAWKPTPETHSPSKQ